MRHSYYYSQRLNKNKTNSLWTNRPKSGIIVGTSYLHPTPYLIGGTMRTIDNSIVDEKTERQLDKMMQGPVVVIAEGDKLTIITQHDIIVCLVESIRPRQLETKECCGDGIEDTCPCGCGVAIQELQVMKRNGKN